MSETTVSSANSTVGNRPWRVVFFGTPELAVPTLQALITDSQFEVVGVVTQPDRPVGRKQVLTPPPVKVVAEQHNIPVLQPRSLRQSKEAGQQFMRDLQALQPDVVALIAYGKIIPQAILDLPSHGFVNAHVSLLPTLRGASPIHHAILEGHERTGVTMMKMDAGMDTGPIISMVEISVDPQETAETLHDKLQVLAAQETVRALPEYLRGEITPQPQDNSQATLCGLIKKSDGQIDWSQSAEYIDRHIRAYTPWPGSYTFCGPDKLRVQLLEAHINDGELIIDTVKPAGKKAMPYEEFLRGNPECALPPVQ